MRDVESAEHVIDKIFKYFPDKDRFYMEKIVDDSDLSHPEKLLAAENYSIEDLLVKDFKYAEYSDATGSYLKLTPLGREVKKAGGHISYLELLANKEVAGIKRQKLNDEKDKYDLLTKKWIYKTRLLPYVVSTGALLLSIYGYFKPEKGQLVTQSMQQEIQRLKLRMNTLDSLYRVDTLSKIRKK